MGMSSDYVEAMKFGSTYVRVGSTIFGPREYPEPKVSDSEGEEEKKSKKESKEDQEIKEPAPSK